MTKPAPIIVAAPNSEFAKSLAVYLRHPTKRRSSMRASIFGRGIELVDWNIANLQLILDQLRADRTSREGRKQ